MEDINPESLVAMKYPLTQLPVNQAARAIYLFSVCGFLEREIFFFKCPHYFEYAACMEMFRTKKYLICFTLGCPQARQGVRFTKSDVKIDETMTRTIHAARRRLQRRDEEISLEELRI